MKYPNPKFTGMSIVTNQAIDSAILDYYPNKSQKGGSQRLDLLKRRPISIRWSIFVLMDIVLGEMRC